MVKTPGISRLVIGRTGRGAPLPSGPIASFLRLLDRELLLSEGDDRACEDMLSAAISAGLVVRADDGALCLTAWGRTVAAILRADDPTLPRILHS
jgi:hypothetical protein